MPAADLMLKDPSSTSTEQATFVESTEGFGPPVLLMGRQVGSGTPLAVRVNADGSILTAPAARRQHWYAPPALKTLAAATSGDPSTPDGSDDFTTVVGWVIVTYANGTDYANGDFVVEVQHCADSDFTAGTFFVSPFSAEAPPANAQSYAANTKVCGIICPAGGKFVRIQVHNTGTSDFADAYGNMDLVTVVR